ncbi:MAG: four helix bundle protein [Salinivirgaceae bacterium]|nr:four helix bundle protein [Salinivirgaceae bacterium]
MESKEKYLKLNDINSYKMAFHLSNYIWDIVISWDYFAKDTVGKQFVRSIDSVSANIAEGFGRYHKKDKIKFYRYAFGSLLESKDWNQKSKIRKLLNEEQYQHVFEELDKLPKEIHALIKYTNDKLTI